MLPPSWIPDRVAPPGDSGGNQAEAMVCRKHPQLFGPTEEDPTSSVQPDLTGSTVAWFFSSLRSDYIVSCSFLVRLICFLFIPSG
uniref:Uncharacterized protein n=1 Tax=Leersia perrieri TaxID=77586 RepID=A0A0D9V8A2_9ORYZ